MSYFLTIFCRSEKRLTVEYITEFINDGVFFDSDPGFISDPSESPKDEFKHIQVFYDPQKRPVEILPDSGAERSEEIDEVIDVIEEFGGDPRLIRRLRETRQTIAIEIDPVGASEEAWEMCDCLERHVAELLDGIIYAPDEAIYDKKLRKLKSLSRD